jgi:hypothetical protein
MFLVSTFIRLYKILNFNDIKYRSTCAILAQIVYFSNRWIQKKKKKLYVNFFRI